MIFLDTSAVLALADTRDPHHAEAVASLGAKMSEGHLLLTHTTSSWSQQRFCRVDSDQRAA